MAIKDLWNKFKKGLKAGVMAIQDNNALTDNKIISIINDFKISSKRNWMITGEKYYEVDNDIFSRKITKKVQGKEVEETYKANNKLAHSKYKNMVDEKIAYLLARDYSLKCDDKSYIEKVKDVLGKHFQYTLSGLGYEASNKGIAWLQVYTDLTGELRTLIIPSEQCIPIWTDRSHTELESMIRVYETIKWEYDKKKSITNVEVWTKDSVTYYILEGKMLIYDYERNNQNNGPIAHYKKGDRWFAWGRVPFVAFKNNRIELPDIKFVKSLIDNYDLSRSEAANYVEEVKNLIFILKGYGGEDIHEFMKRLNEDRAIPIDDPSDGGVDTITPTMDITALREHYEQLKRDIIEDGQSINKDLDKFGSAPSGVALKFMYAGLDLKCNSLETEFKMGFENLLYFINIYLSERGLGSYKNVDIDIIFNRDMEINESEVIENCQKSKGIVSDDTIIANHPWVKDIEVEKKTLKEQKQESLPFQDKIPIGGGVNEE
ncbi:phage portal protein [Clostridium tertium]|uniref:phage portal protein n=1 Tax=Clostridium tertium TaxID=1559 RepID=UPI00232DC9C3|nr:phage portal protein [Clostridium tertium]MDB1935263.1 phage portal protein [Clostridium tertium]MDB1939017.1 phage portal protein [Clostridium tertium]